MSSKSAARPAAWRQGLGCLATCCAALIGVLLAPISAVASQPAASSKAQSKPSSKPSSKSGSKAGKSTAAQRLGKKAPPRPGRSGARSPSPFLADDIEPLQFDSLGVHGSASFYGFGFQGRLVATGERFDALGYTAASNLFPLGTWVAVRRLDTGACAVVRINDRMHTRGKRVIDLSRAAAEHLDIIRAGIMLVRVAPLKRHPEYGGPVPEALCRMESEGVPEPCTECRPRLGEPAVPPGVLWRPPGEAVSDAAAETQP